MVFEECRDILYKESELVQRIARLQDTVWEAVINRDWTDFEGHFSALTDMGVELAVLEAERERVFAGIQPESAEEPSDTLSETNRTSGGFYALVVHLSAVQRNELTEIYRSLKLEVLRVQMSGETLMEFVAGARATLAGFFEAAFPDRGGKIYTPHGIPVSHDMRSMVLNRIF